MTSTDVNVDASSFQTIDFMKKQLQEGIERLRFLINAIFFRRNLKISEQEKPSPLFFIIIILFQYILVPIYQTSRSFEYESNGIPKSVAISLEITLFIIFLLASYLSFSMIFGRIWNHFNEELTIDTRFTSLLIGSALMPFSIFTNLAQYDIPYFLTILLPIAGFVWSMAAITKGTLVLLTQLYGEIKSKGLLIKIIIFLSVSVVLNIIIFYTTIFLMYLLTISVLLLI